MKKSITNPRLIEGRLLSIDALRGIAALGVVLYYAVLQTTNAVPNNFFKWPVKLVQFVSSFGYIGVFLFFVISGFCIHLQWAKSRANQHLSQFYSALSGDAASQALPALLDCFCAFPRNGGFEDRRRRLAFLRLRHPYMRKTGRTVKPVEKTSSVFVQPVPDEA